MRIGGRAPPDRGRDAGDGVRRRRGLAAVFRREGRRARASPVNLGHGEAGAGGQVQDRKRVARREPHACGARGVELEVGLAVLLAALERPDRGVLGVRAQLDGIARARHLDVRQVLHAHLELIGLARGRIVAGHALLQCERGRAVEDERASPRVGLSGLVGHAVDGHAGQIASGVATRGPRGGVTLAELGVLVAVVVIPGGEPRRAVILGNIRASRGLHVRRDLLCRGQRERRGGALGVGLGTGVDRIGRDVAICSRNVEVQGATGHLEGRGGHALLAALEVDAAAGVLGGIGCHDAAAHLEGPSAHGLVLTAFGTDDVLAADEDSTAVSLRDVGGDAPVAHAHESAPVATVILVPVIEALVAAGAVHVHAAAVVGGAVGLNQATGHLDVGAVAGKDAAAAAVTLDRVARHARGAAEGELGAAMQVDSPAAGGERVVSVVLARPGGPRGVAGNRTAGHRERGGVVRALLEGCRHADAAAMGLGHVAADRAAGHDHVGPVEELHGTAGEVGVVAGDLAAGDLEEREVARDNRAAALACVPLKDRLVVSDPCALADLEDDAVAALAGVVLVSADGDGAASQGGVPLDRAPADNHLGDARDLGAIGVGHSRANRPAEPIGVCVARDGAAVHDEGRGAPRNVRVGTQVHHVRVDGYDAAHALLRLDSSQRLVIKNDGVVADRPAVHLEGGVDDGYDGEHAGVGAGVVAGELAAIHHELCAVGHMKRPGRPAHPSVGAGQNGTVLDRQRPTVLDAGNGALVAAVSGAVGIDFQV